MAPRASGSNKASASDPHAVNNRLHTLRGEHFRRSQNAQGSKTHISSAFVPRNTPTLPVRLARLSFDDIIGPSKVTSSNHPIRTYSGPTPPKSWIRSQDKDDSKNSSSWRRGALSLILEHHRTEEELMPPLTTLCLRIMASYPSQEFVEDIVPWIPPHLRRELVRDAAIYAPLVDGKLFPLYEEERHAAGEIIVVGPQASLPEDYFLDPVTPPDEDGHPQVPTVDDWDADESTPEPLSTLVLIKITLNTSTFLSLPPSLTKLALVDLKSPVPLHRLPSTCPLLLTLDLSFNIWLSDEASAEAWLERVEWRTWTDLKLLGFRECNVPESVLQKVNKGRWDDVEIIR